LHIISYHRTAPTRVIDVSIRNDPTCHHTGDLSATSRFLHQDFVARERVGHQDEDAALEHAIMVFNGLHADHGLLSDEFSGL